jgi:hypothetical protein
MARTNSNRRPCRKSDDDAFRQLAPRIAIAAPQHYSQSQLLSNANPKGSP